MKKILKYFTNPIVIALIGLLALSLVIWFVGPQIKLGEDNFAPLESPITRLLIIIVLLGLWGLNNLRIQHRNKQKDAGLVADLQANQKEITRSATDEQSFAEIEQLNERFTRALTTLKQFQFERGGRKKALYELPWYIIIGPPGSGKTTALINSGLEFPLMQEFGKASVQGIGGTRNCDWWFTNEAVLIDTAGRYTTQDSHRVVDSSAWEGFLGLLKRNRPRRPINGAIVAVSVQDLLMQTEEERAMHAKTIRARIDELMAKLQIRFPIYMMFTKLDLVAGFNEFFTDLSREEREQVWGVSLPNMPKPNQSPDFPLIDREFSRLTQRIYDRLLWRMHQEREVKRRGLIQGFPQQFENVQPLLRTFIKQAFAENRYQLQPYLRGVYFSSGTQDGTPIDRLMTAVAASFGFTPEVSKLPNQQGKSFFLNHLFRKVIFPESELVGSDRRYETMILWARRGGYIGAVTLSLIFIIIWAGTVTRHKGFMNEVQNYIAEYTAESKRINSYNKDIRLTLPALAPLAKASVVYDLQKHPVLRGVGLYDNNVDVAAEKAYQSQLDQLFLPRLIHTLETELANISDGSDLYSTFKTYMMLYKTEYLDRQQVRDWFDTYWRQYSNEQRQELLTHLDQLLDEDLDFKPIAVNERLVSDTRQLLLRVPVAKRVYSRLRSNPKYSQRINLINQLGESVRTVYSVTDNTKELLIPVMFTKEGYENIDLSSGSTIVQEVANERWLLSDENSDSVQFVRDNMEEISKEVEEYYLAEYVQVWLDVLSALQITEFENLQYASNTLESLTDPVYSPLISILQVVTENTQLTPPVLANLADDNTKGKKGKAAAWMAETFDGNIVDKRFREIHVLLRETERAPAPIGIVIKQIQDLQAYVDEMVTAADPAKAAFERAQSRYQSGSGNAITALKTYAKTTPEVVKLWLDSIANQTWKVILQSARQHVNNEWYVRVYRPYQQSLAKRYPLDRKAKEELAPYDFGEFFKPSGQLDQFFQEYLNPFLNTRGSWGNKAVDGYSLGISNELIAQLQRANRIKGVFFRDNPNLPGLTFQLRPFEMNKKDARFMLEVGDIRLTYNHGPKFWTSMVWSGSEQNTRVRMRFEAVNGTNREQVYDGYWAWFRLQDQSGLSNTGESNIQRVTYSIPGPGVEKDRYVEYDIKANGVDNPFSQDLLGRFRLPESI